MSDENVIDFYKDLEWEEIEIENGITALFFETATTENYALITNDDGLPPSSLRETIVFACYTAEGSFLWSISFKNSFLFKEIWTKIQSPADKIEAIRKYRETIEYYQ